MNRLTCKVAPWTSKIVAVFGIRTRLILLIVNVPDANVCGSPAGDIRLKPSCICVLSPVGGLGLVVLSITLMFTHHADVHASLACQARAAQQVPTWVLFSLPLLEAKMSLAGNESSCW